VVGEREKEGKGTKARKVDAVGGPGIKESSARRDSFLFSDGNESRGSFSSPSVQKLRQFEFHHWTS